MTLLHISASQSFNFIYSFMTRVLTKSPPSLEKKKKKKKKKKDKNRFGLKFDVLRNKKQDVIKRIKLMSPSNDDDLVLEI